MLRDRGDVTEALAKVEKARGNSTGANQKRGQAHADYTSAIGQYARIRVAVNFLHPRNDRAHGGTPSFAEKRLLMINIQYLANLYIDYIKLFDDFTRSL